jgi:serine phosphatase RsbU (regulator of sigma subunit)
MAAISGMSGNSVSQQADHQRLTLLFRQAHAASIVALISAIAVVVVFYAIAPGTQPLLWCAVVLLATILRLRLYHRFFAGGESCSEDQWLRRHALTAGFVGVAWGSIPLIQLGDAAGHYHQLQTLIPGFVLMAAITSYGVYLSQYLVLWLTVGLTTIVTRLAVSGQDGLPEALLFALFAPLLLITAKRYSKTLAANLDAKRKADKLVKKLTVANGELHRQNDVLAQQRDLIDQEEALAKHVFQQLVIGGDRKLPGVHTWNQSMGSLSGDLIQTAKGPDGQAYIFLADFTGHGLPAALGALPASSVFLAMAGKGLPLGTIAAELNKKLHELLPVGYFCCAVLIELSADRRTVKIWNGGLPPVLVRRYDQIEYEKIASHSLPLGVVSSEDFAAETTTLRLDTGDQVYAYTDGLTEAENADGEMWGADRLETFLAIPEMPTPRLPALIDTILEHVNLAPPSDDISVVEIEIGADAGDASEQRSNINLAQA